MPATGSSGRAYGEQCLGRFAAPKTQAKHSQANAQLNFYVGTAPIPQAVLDIKTAIETCRKGQHGFPLRAELASKFGDHLYADGRGVRSGSPLANFAGDTRIFDETMWKFLCNTGGAEVLWKSAGVEDMQFNQVAPVTQHQSANLVPHGQSQAESLMSGTLQLAQAAAESAKSFIANHGLDKRKTSPPKQKASKPAVLSKDEPKASQGTVGRAEDGADDKTVQIQRDRLCLFQKTLNPLLYTRNGPQLPFINHAAVPEELIAAINMRLKRGIEEFGTDEALSALDVLSDKSVVALGAGVVLALE